jgi:hypothetical protein
MSLLSQWTGININFAKLFRQIDPKGMAQHVLDNLKPALITMANRDIAQVPDNISVADAGQLIEQKIGASLKGAMDHDPLLGTLGAGLLRELRAQISRTPAIDARSLKAQITDWVDARIQGARL